MSFFYRIILIIMILVPTALFAEVGQASVVVYTNASPALYGRSPGRQRLTEVDLESFADSESVRVGSNGIPTAVLIDARVKKAVDNLLSDRDFVIVENSVIRREPDFGSNAYGFTWDRYGFDIIFSFEPNNEAIMSEVEKVYGSDAYLLGELRRSYDDNYSIWIHQAEDVLKPFDGRITFLEAMISATVIGSNFQPLFGIHDGLGVLDELGLAGAQKQMFDSENYIEYRKYLKNADEIYSFIHQIRGMPGDFIDNLYSAINDISRKHSDDGKIILPEEFFEVKTGDNTDYVLFYFDILKRSGYQVRFIVIDEGLADGSLYTSLFFREKGADLWGWIDGNSLERERTENWRRLPALVFSASVNYFEPDIEDIIRDGEICLPPPSQWSSSLY